MAELYASSEGANDLERMTSSSHHGRRSMAPSMHTVMSAASEHALYPLPHRTGVLYVKGFFNRWRRLTVRLENHVLTISIIKRGVLKRVFKLTPQTKCEDSNVRHFCFSLTNESDEKIFFSADNISSKEAWVDCIQSSLALLRIGQRKLRGRDKRKLHVNEVNQYINRPIIYVKVVRARNVAAADAGNLSDPYVKITLGGSCVRTTTRTKTLCPEWGMIFPLDWDASMRYIHVEVWDEDYTNPDDFLGCVSLPVLSLRDGDCLRRWYPLGKKSSRGVVSGEIELEISCSGQPDREQLAWQFFQEVQRLPEFSVSLAACADGSGQVAIRNGPYGPLISRNQQQPEGANNDSREAGETLQGFPFFFPAIEHESLEDIALNVSVMSTLNTGKVSAPGILLCTSHRLLFVSLNRILASNDNEDARNATGLTAGIINVGNDVSSWGDELGRKSFEEIDLSTEIPMNGVVSVQLTTDTDNFSSTSYEAIRLRVSDGRQLTLLFKDDSATYNGAMLSSLGASSLNRAIEQFFRDSAAVTRRRPANAAESDASPSLAAASPSERVTSSRKRVPLVDRLARCSALEASWVRMIRGASSAVLEGADAIEGPPPHRLYARLKSKLLNRPAERYTAVTQLYPVLHALREACGLFTFPPPRSYSELIEGEVLESTDDKDIVEAAVSVESKEATAEDADEEFLLEGIEGVSGMESAEKEEAKEEEVEEENTERESDAEVDAEVSAMLEAATMGAGSSQSADTLSSSSMKANQEGDKEQKINTVAQKRSCATIEQLAMRVSQSPQLIDAFTKLFFNFESAWHIYNPLGEFRRMGVPNSNWRITSVNASYGVCPSYPAVLAVPAMVDDETVVNSSLFRSKNRFPTLSWLHRNGCSLSRCSQPLIGITNNRNEHDERLLSCINRCSQPVSTSSSNSSGFLSSQPSLTSFSVATDASFLSPANNNSNNVPLKPYVIVDARPLLNAKANQAVGKGVESEKVYENVTVLFMDIANIHAVRKSMEMVEDAMQDETTWARNLEASGWLTYIRKILIAAGRITHCISRENVSVLVHCSDGWDRTSQLTSLSMLLMDPYYRTLEGFIVLIEKEWLSFGHKFADRLGWTRDGWKDEEKSPIFVQFLDCVHQCLLQMPSAFEFTQQLLLFLMEHLYSGWFSNFVFNCEREMKEFEPWKSSVSIWSAVLANKSLFINDGFYPTENVITPVVSKTRLVFWSEWFLRWHDRVWTFNWIETHQIDSGKSGLSHIQWVDDKSVTTCYKCQRKFSFFVRKHHCRCCGNIFCDSCSKETRVIVAVSKWRPVRCCTECACNIDTSLLDDLSSEIGASRGLSGLGNRATTRSSVYGAPRSAMSLAAIPQGSAMDDEE